MALLKFLNDDLDILSHIFCCTNTYPSFCAIPKIICSIAKCVNDGHLTPKHLDLSGRMILLRFSAIKINLHYFVYFSIDLLSAACASLVSKCALLMTTILKFISFASAILSVCIITRASLVETNSLINVWHTTLS